MSKFQEIIRCIDCKHWPGDGYKSNVRCPLTGEQLTAQLSSDLEPVDVFNEVGQQCPLPNMWELFCQHQLNQCHN